MGLQDVLLVVLYFYYSGQFGFAFLLVPTYAASFYVLGSGMTPLSVLEKLQACCIVMLTGSKVRKFFKILELSFFVLSTIPAGLGLLGNKDNTFNMFIIVFNEFQIHKKKTRVRYMPSTSFLSLFMM